MIYQGKAIRVEKHADGIARLTFDTPDASVNVFNQAMLDELRAATAALAASDARGLLVCSAKAHFVVGADIKEFTGLFRQSAAQLQQWVSDANAVFNAVEELPMPTVSVINGMALGGGLEMALATDFRVAAESAALGFPEVNLGICPGFGGTVRAPRVFDVQAAMQWISSGRPVKAMDALTVGAVDSVAADDMLEQAALELLQQAIDGELDHLAVRRQKTGAMNLGADAAHKLFSAGIEAARKASGEHYPAAVTALEAMADAAGLERAGALALEHKAFVTLARSNVAHSLVQCFLNEQTVKSQARRYSQGARDVQRIAVLGAGIMGGGIAYQSALKGIPARMKDIAQQGLDLGMQEADKLLSRQVAKGRMNSDQAAAVLQGISPQLDYTGFDGVDLVVEAVVENIGVKQKVLAETEQQLPEHAVLTSNTSTISITHLAKSLARPENFCGMHFFNPVPLMPLVEVIRGEHSSAETIATTVALAQRIGKTPIVVNDCPGFLINRVLFPYFGAFCQLLRDGADLRQVDAAMEAFGWPMGPAYLLDVVGIDTAAHCLAVMAEGFPDRMQYNFTTAIDFLHEAGDYGQKSGRGFYVYERDADGRRQKVFDPAINERLEALRQQPLRDFSAQEIVERMMLAMCLETVRCLEDGIVQTPAEADMGLLLGLGFPRFRGGPLCYVDAVGAAAFCELADSYRELGPLFQATDGLRQMAKQGGRFY